MMIDKKYISAIDKKDISLLYELEMKKFLLLYKHEDIIKFIDENYASIKPCIFANLDFSNEIRIYGMNKILPLRPCVSCERVLKDLEYKE